MLSQFKIKQCVRRQKSVSEEDKLLIQKHKILYIQHQEFLSLFSATPVSVSSKKPECSVPHCI